MPEFVITLDGREIERLQLDKELIAIGRAKENDIVVENLATSRHHAQVSCHGGQYYLTDLDSSNGTQVNGKRISRSPLSDGDTICVGKHEIRFVLPEGETAPPEDDFADFNQTMVMPVEAMPAHFLAIRAIRRRDTVVPLTQDRVEIGRGLACDIRIVDWFVDLTQAVLEIRGADCSVRDLGRTRPTLVNGRPVRETLLRDGDVIQVGFTQLAYTTDPGQAQDHPGLKPLQDIHLAPENDGQEPGDSTEDSSLAVAEAAIAEEAIPEEVAEPEEVAPAIEPEPVEEAVDEAVFAGKPDLEFPEEENAEPEPEAEPTADEIEAEPEGVEEPEFVEAEAEILTVGVAPEGDETADAVDLGEELDLEDLDFEETPVEMGEGVAMDMSEVDADLADTTPSIAAGIDGWGDEDTAVREAEPESVELEAVTLEDTSPVEIAGAASEVPEAIDRIGEEAACAPDEEETVEVTEDVEADHEEEPAAAPVSPQVAIWEKALQNPSAAVRKQAAAQLKRLTGRDYDV